MKTSIRILAGWMAVMAVLATATAWAAPLSGTMGVWIAIASTGQTSPAVVDSANARDEADSLLRRAREAMASDRLDLAESLIATAEALDPDYGLLHVGDTPKKARRDLDRQRREAAGEPTGLGRLLPQPSSVTRLPQTDPFAGRSAPPVGTATATADLGPSPYDVAPLPSVGLANPIRPTATAGPSTSFTTGVSQRDSASGVMQAPHVPLFNGDTTQFAPAGLAATNPTRPATASATATDHRTLLLEARRALVVGDVQRATSLANQVKRRQISYAPLDDTPEKVEEAVRQYQEVMSEPAQTDSQRRRRVRMWLGQAESLLQYNDYESAERVATFASQERLAYGPFEARPQDILDRIAAARSQESGLAGTSASTAVAEASDLPGPSVAARTQAVELARAARAALEAGQLDRAEMLARRAEQLGVPDSVFAAGDERPGLVMLDIRRERLRGGSAVRLASGEAVVPAAGMAAVDGLASPAVYEPSLDSTRTVRAANQQPFAGAVGGAYELAQSVPTPAPPEAMPVGGSVAPLSAAEPSEGETLFALGQAAMREGDTQSAYEYFQQAARHRAELDSITQQRLQTQLELLSMGPSGPATGGPTGSIVSETAAQQQALARKVATDIAQQAARAREVLPTDPAAAMAMMEEAAQAVQLAGLEPATREQLLRIVDRHMVEMQNYVEQNRHRMALEEDNRQTLDEIERERLLKLDVQDRLAQMVDEFNRLMQEQRYAEAEVVAKRAAELAPYEMITQQLVNQAKFVRRYFSNLALQDELERGVWGALDAVSASSVPFDDRYPYRFPDSWEDLSSDRQARLLREQGRPRTEREMEIERKLRTPVSFAFEDRPLSEVLDYLAKLTEINLFLDPQGLAEEGVPTNAPVTLEVRHEIMLKSALNLILDPLHLSYVVKDEVLKVTSEQLRDGEVYVQTYNVADLVIPIPNFIPGETGLAAALHRALGNVGYGGSLGMGAPPVSVVASRDGGKSTGVINPGVLAQVSAQGGGAGSVGYGPGGMGGASGADFDSLIDLIIATVEPLSWDEAGGGGSIAPFGTNLSIVVSNTQEVHEKVVDLLEQLRRMQDLQVTIEVRFITLNDNFFERLGIDFDFDIDDNIDRPFQVFGRADPDAETEYVTEFTANNGVARDVIDRDGGQSVTVGMALPDLFSADLDIPFRQGSFNLAVPQFGGFAADAGAQIGFAILSDIEAFFFINAAQGDRRSNVLQAPKVTLFNGQQAMISDTSQSPFVSSVVPVVGDFAAAQQPVIVVLSEGTSMTVQAVVSNDRRFVRLTVVPFFSKIGDVNTFQFTGSETTTTSTAAEGIQDEPNDSTKSANESTVTRSGTTVQLPTYSSVQVTTTVSVPDGGTVLLGGIKRLSEGRNEFGVPMLDKIPYINRLFKNVGIGRETQSLMMMVTPRIIIQEEEEIAQTGYTPP